jgi:ribosomal protein S18 acetylase RimI-like enzyme
MISLIDIIIEKEYRNMGIGKMMLSFLEEKAKEHGISSIEVPVYAFNKRASEFYENNGYHKYVERKVKEIRN